VKVDRECELVFSQFGRAYFFSLAAVIGVSGNFSVETSNFFEQSRFARQFASVSS